MEGSGQFLLLDDALRVKGRCTKRLCEHPGAGEQWVCIGSMCPKKSIENLKNFFSVFDYVFQRLSVTNLPKSIAKVKFFYFAALRN